MTQGKQDQALPDVQDDIEEMTLEQVVESAIKSSRSRLGAKFDPDEDETEIKKKTNNRLRKHQLFTKEIESKLQKQYPLGNELENQMVVCKVFNPYGRGTWYIINQDPEDRKSVV